MGLRIQHNIAALNAHRHLLVSDAGLSKSLERLSSGFRINRAADDAAGMAISSGFRADIASYKVASRNTAEANSLLQVAEGAFDQISAMLVRLKELATQAASANAGSNLDKLNAEGNALIDEIDRIAQVTEYAGSKLINGTFGVGVSAGSTATASTGVTTAQGMIAQEIYNLGYAAASAGKVDVTVTTGDGSWTITDVAIADAGETSQVTFSAFGLTVTFNENLTSTLADATVIGTDTGNATFQVGSESSADNRISVSLGDVTTEASGLNITKDQLDNAVEAQGFLTTINNAISTLNDRRGEIGAIQNRLGYAAANLTATIENVTAAESVIRDVDMALEMTEFTKNQILLQAGTAMLAQANMAPQLVFFRSGVFCC
jgi:flagellin